MADLPTNLKDDILDSSANTKRKYRMIENEDGTYSFEDATEYSQVGDEYGAGLINETNKQVNARVEKAVVVPDLATIGAITQPGFIPDALAVKEVSDSLGGLTFGIDGDGNVGYYGADGSLIPFNHVSFEFVESLSNQTSTQAVTVTLDKGIYMIHAFSSNYSSGTWLYDITADNDIEFNANIHNNGKASTFTSGVTYTGMAMIYLDVKSDGTLVTIDAEFSGTLSYAYSVYGIYKIG